MLAFFWVVDLIIPVTIFVFGLLWKKHAPKQINKLYGYRTYHSMKSQEAWDYAHKLVSEMWLLLGKVLIIGIVLSKLIIPIHPGKLSAFHAAISLIVLVIPFPVIETKLRKRF